MRRGRAQQRHRAAFTTNLESWIQTASEAVAAQKQKRPLPPKVKIFISSSFFKGSLADYHLNLAINARYI
jgi:hypothetical protein